MLLLLSCSHDPHPHGYSLDPEHAVQEAALGCWYATGQVHSTLFPQLGQNLLPAGIPVPQLMQYV